MDRRGFLRFFVVCLIMIFVIGLNITDKINSVEPKEIIREYDVKINVQEQNYEKTEEKAEKKDETDKKSESTPVLAESVKGKIIERYISPYTAPLSYNGVYLKNNTGTNINLKNLMSGKLGIKIKETKNPQVLIMHTHTTECYMEKDTGYYYEDSLTRTTNNNKNMAKIGEIIAEKLNESGIVTLHDKTQHDYPQYTGSYSRSAKTVNSYLKKYPDIKVVIDLHRDSVSSGENDKVKLVTQIKGKKAAQVMLVMGSQTGGITGFPKWQENLKLAMKLHQVMEKKYPTLARPILLNSKKYNQNLTTGSLLIEVGTEANTIEEASFSAEMVADSLIELLKGIK